jgi:Delta14-sterol reductase
VSYGAIALLTFGTGWLHLAWAADHFLELLSGASVLGLSLAITLYIASFRAGAVLAESASGVVWYDFWMGRELNPRLFGIDLKEFCEIYPGLAAWAVLNLAFLHKQLLETRTVRPATSSCHNVAVL